ncbi:uncharacterized protein LDX57_008865 [Aspergillus melleus]|uniref:uncharacterized protein n=1 Tax=Aspergillus melleus TaxID=138277 RepID=UPI001E8EB9F7|nr:uncharacterized protein LDX57_008865 [Aspergillus melleus]KAH8431206.1 hypothetical protein LDX57_008865 [Aspergillus melleus]
MSHPKENILAAICDNDLSIAHDFDLTDSSGRLKDGCFTWVLVAQCGDHYFLLPIFMLPQGCEAERHMVLGSMGTQVNRYCFAPRAQARSLFTRKPIPSSHRTG